LTRTRNPNELTTVLLLQTAIFALLLTRLTADIGYRQGLTDQPNGRKQHLHPVPLTGGIAIFLTILCGILVVGIEAYNYPLLAIACLVFIVGVFDDIRHLSATLRLLIQFGCGLLLATYGGIAIYDVGNLLANGAIPLLALSAPLTALSVAGLCNAYNMIDGIDGLAASTIALPLLVLYVFALRAAHPMAEMLLLMLVPLAVFLLFNLGPNSRLLPKIFLGDGGSVTLGFLVAASLVFFSQGENALIKPVTALWLVAVPLMDMLATMLRRARAGRGLMTADRSHLHHALLDLGLGSRQALLLIIAYAALCAVLGLTLESGPAYLSLLAYSLLFCGHCLFVITASRDSDKPNSQDVRAGRRYCERGFLRVAPGGIAPATSPDAGSQ
jgi:UDP-GlcNAc:undecaprenyl-phosphate GlcNAc-1-phosphate transferase